MPKHIDSSNKNHPRAIRSKHKVGNRKSAVSAHQMTNNDLIEALANEGRKRNKTNILHVMQIRGIPMSTQPQNEGES